MGAYLAFEMACRLQAQGERVALLAVINTDGLWKLVHSFGGGLRYHWRNLGAGAAGPLGYLRDRMRSRLRSTADLAVNLALAARIRGGRQIPQKLLARYVRARHLHASRQYWPAAPYRGDLLFLQGSEEGPREYGAFWQRVVEGKIISQVVAGKGIGVLKEPNVHVLAERLSAALHDVNTLPVSEQVFPIR